jgi:hypothetical protein
LEVLTVLIACQIFLNGNEVSVTRLSDIPVGLADAADEVLPITARVRRKGNKFLNQTFDLLLVISWELVVASSDVARRVPAATPFDPVSATLEAQLRDRKFNGWKRRLSYAIRHRVFDEFIRISTCSLVAEEMLSQDRLVSRPNSRSASLQRYETRSSASSMTQMNEEYV